MSIQIEELALLLNEAEIPADKYNKIIQSAEALEEEKKQERALNKEKKGKNQFIVLVKTHKEITDDDLVAHVFQIPQEDDPNDLLKKVVKAGTEQNLTSKRKNNLVKEFDDVVHIKRKFLKEQNIMLKTKEDWTRVVVLPQGTAPFFQSGKSL